MRARATLSQPRSCGDQVFSAQERLTVETKPVLVCRTALRQTLAKSEAALMSYDAANLNDQKNFGLQERLEDKANRDYRRCFAARLREQQH